MSSTSLNRCTNPTAISSRDSTLECPSSTSRRSASPIRRSWSSSRTSSLLAARPTVTLPNGAPLLHPRGRGAACRRRFGRGDRTRCSAAGPGDRAGCASGPGGHAGRRAACCRPPRPPRGSRQVCRRPKGLRRAPRVAPAAPPRGLLLRPDTALQDMMRAANAGDTGMSHTVLAAAGVPPVGFALAVRGESPASHRDERGASRARRDDREYSLYLTEEQRRPRGGIAHRMQTDFHHGLLGVATRWKVTR